MEEGGRAVGSKQPTADNEEVARVTKWQEKRKRPSSSRGGLSSASTGKSEGGLKKTPVFADK
jgi:hypothetical protein